MMLFLVSHISHYARQKGFVECHDAITFLPTERRFAFKTAVIDPMGRTSLDMLNKFGWGKRGWERSHQMHMVFCAVQSEHHTAKFFAFSTDDLEQFPFKFIGDQRQATFRPPDKVEVNAGKNMPHRFFTPLLIILNCPPMN